MLCSAKLKCIKNENENTWHKFSLKDKKYKCSLNIHSGIFLHLPNTPNIPLNLRSTTIV